MRWYLPSLRRNVLLLLRLRRRPALLLRRDGLLGASSRLRRMHLCSLLLLLLLLLLLGSRVLHTMRGHVTLSSCLLLLLLRCGCMGRLGKCLITRSLMPCNCCRVCSVRQGALARAVDQHMRPGGVGGLARERGGGGGGAQREGRRKEESISRWRESGREGDSE